MAKLLILGTGPLFEEGVRYLGAQSLRTWYFVQPLLERGHQIRLVTLPLYDADDERMHNAALTRRSIDGFEYQAFSNADIEFAKRTLTRLVRSFRPEGIIAINSFPAWIAARLPVRVPMWADLNGYEMAEKQGQAAALDDDAPLERAWQVETSVLRRADKVSVVSRPQLHALLGEMAMLGRLNHLTFRYQFGHHVPNAWHPMFGEPIPDDAEPVLRGKDVPADALVVLWSGGYNFWTDPDRLFEFIESAMEAESRLHYVSTGGAIQGYNDATYTRFRERVAESSHAARYHLLGWVDGADLPRIYEEADVGLNFDAPNYETLFGARNRLTNLMAAGVPILTTHGTEISRVIEETRCGFVRSGDDPVAMRRALLDILHSPALMEHMSETGRRVACERFSPETACCDMVAWADSPRFSPDNYLKLERFPEAVSFLDCAINDLQEEAMVLGDFDIEELQRDAGELRELRAHPVFRAGRWVKRTAMAPVEWVRGVFPAAEAGETPED